MIICLYDGTAENYFTAVFELYKNKTDVQIITEDKNIQCDFDTQFIEYKTDNEKAERIIKFVKKHIKTDGYRKILYALCSGKQNKGIVIYNFLKMVFEYKNKAPYMLNNKNIIDFFDIFRAVQLEAHRMKGFIHFKECENNIYYAEYEPDNNITEFIMPHFCNRFSSMAFLIHDVKRNIVGIYNKSEYKVFKNKGKLTVYLSQNEQDFVNIWKMYYKTVNIEQRKNTKLMKQFMPKRYWKHLIEKE